MTRLRREKLHVMLTPRVTADGPVTPRFYTLTHSDLTGDLFLTIDSAYNKDQISGLYTQLMRDEVLAQWEDAEQGQVLHVHCHVSGGLTLGLAAMRLTIFKRELPLVLQALRYGNRGLFEARRALDQASIEVHFHATQPRYDRVERWGVPGDHRHES